MDSRVTIMCVFLATSELTKEELVMAPMCVRNVLQVKLVQQDGQILKNYAISKHSKLVKNTPLRAIFSTHLLMLGNVTKHAFSCLIYCFKPSCFNLIEF